MSASVGRAVAIAMKEFTEFRRNRFIIATSAILPLVFLISPTASGTAVGSIDRRQTAEIPVEPGRHTLRVQSSPRFLSRERSFEADDEETVSFSCRSQMLWPMYIAALVQPDLWISLKQN